MKTKKLSDLVDIQSGYTFRGAVKDVGSGIRVIQAKDISLGTIEYSSLPFVADEIPGSKLLNDGDILLTSRGSFRAAVYRGDVPSIASSSLFVLRPRSADLISDFMTVYLNSDQAQAYFSQSARGATIKSVRIPDLSALNVPILTMDKQYELTELDSIVKKILSDLDRKSQLIKSMHGTTINKTLEGVR